MNNKFIKSTLILIVGGIITKLLSFIIKIYFTRVIGDGINIYSLIMPTYSLLITITQLGFPIAISNIVAKKTKSGKNIIVSIVPLSIILNIILIVTMIFLSRYISNVLNSNDTYYPLICLSLVLPFISISSILRGYFFGKQQMMPHSISNIIEQLFKLGVVLIVLPKVIKYGPVISVCIYILISILSETISIIVFLLYLPKNFKIKKDELKPDLGTIKDVLSIGLPSVGTRIIGNIGYFLEPILLTTFMIKAGYSSSYIIHEYAIYNTYSLGVIIVPTFLIMALSSSLLPELSKNICDKDKIKKIFRRIIFITIFFGILSNAFMFVFSKYILLIIFNTTEGLNYLKFLSIFFTLYYLESPLASVLEAYNKTGYLMFSTTIGIILKLIIMSMLSLLKIGIYSLLISEVIYIIIVVALNYFKYHMIMKKST